MMRLLTLLCLSLISILFSACSSVSYRYVVSNPSGANQTSEASYGEPANQPQGTVRVRSLGVVDLRPKGKSTRIPALHIRMTLALNQNAAQNWNFESELQKVSFVNDAAESPLFANSNSATLPKVEVKPGDLRAVDLYYAIPANTGPSAEVPEFVVNWQLSWQVDGSQGKIADSTRFERAINPQSYPAAYPYDPYPIGYGPIWWEGAPPIVVGSPVRIRN